ncbi:MAG: bactofilin family protein [Candidatus Aminicenantales bacterium]
MSPEKEEAAHSRSEKRTVIGPEVLIEGEIKGQQDVVIEGQVRGKIHLSSSDLVVTERGRVEANIQARNITIQGEVNGDIEASNRVSIESTGRMKGNISAGIIAIQDGARFKGTVKIVNKL